MNRDHGYLTEPRWQEQRNRFSFGVLDLLHEAATLVVLALVVGTIGIWAAIIGWMVGP